MPRKTHATTGPLSHPEWCAQRHPDRCGQEAMFPSEQFHESLRKTFAAYGHPTEGGEPFIVVSNWYLMDGKTYEDDPEFDGGLQVAFNDPGTDDDPVSIAMGSRDLRALAQFLEVEADAYDAWRRSQDAQAHAGALKAALETNATPKPINQSVEKPDTPSSPAGSRPDRLTVHTPASVEPEWHPSFCQQTGACDPNQAGEDPRHLSKSLQFKRPSSSSPGLPGGTGEELFAAVMAQLSHHAGAGTSDAYRHEACVVLTNKDDDRTVSFTADSIRMRELGNWLLKSATWVDGQHEEALAEIEQRHHELKVA